MSSTYAIQLVNGPLDGTIISPHEMQGGIYLHIQKLKSPYCFAYKLKDEAHHHYKRVCITRAKYVGYTLEGERNAGEIFNKYK